jgi:hypothetical protein
VSIFNLLPKKVVNQYGGFFVSIFNLLPKRKPLSEEFPEPPEAPGLHLEVQHQDNVSIKLLLSEPVALILAPCLLVLSVETGRCVWLNYLPHSPTTQPVSTETQPRK